VVEDKIADMLRLFPKIRPEGGKLDLDRLKLALGEAVEVGKDRHGMNWPGKADCFKTIQAASLGTLRPCPTESVNFDTTENLIIEGDNLEILKFLQKSYLGKVKLIYIDRRTTPAMISSTWTATPRACRHIWSTRDRPRKTKGTLRCVPFVLRDCQRPRDKVRADSN
jgi:hypothetical protein